MSAEERPPPVLRPAIEGQFVRAEWVDHDEGRVRLLPDLAVEMAVDVEPLRSALARCAESLAGFASVLNASMSPALAGAIRAAAESEVDSGFDSVAYDLDPGRCWKCDRKPGAEELDGACWKCWYKLTGSTQARAT